LGSGDSALQLKVMEREPKSVEDALNCATKQEAFETSLSAYGHSAYGHAGGQDEVHFGKPQKAPVVEDAGSDIDMSSLCQQVNQLQAELSKTTKSLEGLAANAGCVQKVPPGSTQSKQNVGASNRSQAPLDLWGRSKNRLLMQGISPGCHQAEVAVGVEVVVCTDLQQTAMFVGL